MRNSDAKVDGADPAATIVGEGLVLRPWLDTDAHALVTLYNTEEMNEWTPVAHPFDLEQARSYLQRAAARAAHEMVQRAVTEDGVTALGEILLFATEVPLVCELGYAVNADSRGRSIAARSVRAMLPVAEELGYVHARLQIVTGNEPSEAVARRTGFSPTANPPILEHRKGRTVALATWTRQIAAAPADGVVHHYPRRGARRDGQE